MKTVQPKISWIIALFTIAGLTGFFLPTLSFNSNPSILGNSLETPSVPSSRS
ncbi:MAG: hypothetical protein SFW36_05100 [Leptolyngbyaceae cyanobacterium bins.59]|nr:hypothetical protein [Leptolyngbyaceae cyanobacterium bins.59]